MNFENVSYVILFNLFSNLALVSNISRCDCICFIFLEYITLGSSCLGTNVILNDFTDSLYDSSLITNCCMNADISRNTSSVICDHVAIIKLFIIQ